MKTNKKLSLENLKVTSFVTNNLYVKQEKTIQGGLRMAITIIEDNTISGVYDCSTPNQCIATNKTGQNFCPAC